MNTADTKLLFRVLLSIAEMLNCGLTVRRDLLRRIEQLDKAQPDPVAQTQEKQ